MMFTSGQKDEVTTNQMDEAPCSTYNLGNAGFSKAMREFDNRLGAVTVVEGKPTVLASHSNGDTAAGEITSFNYTRVISSGGVRPLFYFFALRECLVDPRRIDGPEVICELDVVATNRNGEHLGRWPSSHPPSQAFTRTVRSCQA